MFGDHFQCSSRISGNLFSLAHFEAAYFKYTEKSFHASKLEEFVRFHHDCICVETVGIYRVRELRKPFAFVLMNLSAFSSSFPWETPAMVTVLLHHLVSYNNA